MRTFFRAVDGLWSQSFLEGVGALASTLLVIGVAGYHVLSRLAHVAALQALPPLALMFASVTARQVLPFHFTEEN